MSDWDGLSPLEIDNQRLREELDAAKRAAAAYEAWKFPEDIQALTVANERLRKENEKLWKALKPFAEAAYSNMGGNLHHLHTICSVVTLDDLRRARAAIREGGEGD